MEAVVSCCIGVLVAGGVGGALSVQASREEAARSHGKVTAVYLIRKTGEGVLRSGLLPASMRDAALCELRACEVHGRRPWEYAGEADAAGALVATAAGCAALLAAASGSAVGGMLGLLAVPATVMGRASARAHAERTRIETQMPEAFGALAVSLGSGLSIAQALRYVGSHAEEPIRGELVRASGAIMCGVPVAQALDELIERLEAPGLELVALAMKVSQRTGAPLGSLLADAARLAGDRIELLRQLDVKTSQARMSARLVAAMPVAMVGFLALFSTDFRAGLMTVPGTVSVLVALGLNGIALVAIRRIMKVRM